MSTRRSRKQSGLLARQLSESELFLDLADQASQHRLKVEAEPRLHYLVQSTQFQEDDQASQVRITSEDEPLSQYLWKSTKSQRDDALQSKFIQGLRNGNLDPTDFGGFMVQDSIYCYYSMESIGTAAEKATDPSLKALLEKKLESFKRQYEELFKLWHIRDPSGIDLSKECQDYVALEKNIAETMDSLYLVVALIPCYKLWSWLGKQILNKMHNFGVYESWVMSNLDSTYDGYKIMEQCIDNAFLVGKLDKEQALFIYKGCMTGEANFFGTV